MNTQRPQWIHCFLATFSLMLLIRMGENPISAPTGLDVLYSFLIAVMVTALFEMMVYFFADFIWEAMQAEVNSDNGSAPSVAKEFFARAESLRDQPVLLEGHQLYVQGRMITLNDDDIHKFKKLFRCHSQNQSFDWVDEDFFHKMVRVGVLTEAHTLTPAALTYAETRS